MTQCARAASGYPDGIRDAPVDKNGKPQADVIAYRVQWKRGDNEWVNVPETGLRNIEVPASSMVIIWSVYARSTPAVHRVSGQLPRLHT
ncbi:hypothetical protein EIN43_06055 [Enterobacter hormaechei]|uniref:Uncharacterized protein n=1 Tax=Enterobacter hormaechei TaxID=158836 RepID=A0A4Y5ZQU1_9ENTR|nr:hypothetical protein EIN43_06055 [Enterobacter hormaechei]